MKKGIITGVCLIGAAVIIMLLLCRGCSKPGDFALLTPEAKWVSTDPDIYFSLMDEDKGTNYGQMVIDGEVIEIVAHFDHGTGVIFSYFNRPNPEAISEEDNIFWGDCRIRRDKIIVEVQPSWDFKNVFGGETIEIVFHREEPAEDPEE